MAKFFLRGAEGGSDAFPPLEFVAGLEPAIKVGGQIEGDVRVGTGNDESRSDDSQFVSRSAVKIGHGQGGSNDKASGGETNQEHPYPHSHVQTERRSGQERKDLDEERAGQVDPPPQPEPDIGGNSPTPSIPQGSGSEGTRTAPFHSLPLTNYTGNPAVPDPVLANAATSKDKSDQEDTASSAAKSFLRKTERTSNTFPLLKLVAAGLCAVLDNCEVQSTFILLISNVYSSCSTRWSNRK